MAGWRLLAFVVAMATGCFAREGRIWSITVGHDWGAHEYFDNAGYLKGFGLQMIDLVCQEGRMDCRIVWDLYVRCWDSHGGGQHPSGGVGLMSRWYDACTGWIPTVERIHTFAFSAPYMELLPANFYTLPGANFDATDMAGKTIGFLDGWATSEQCVARLSGISNNVLDADQIMHFGYPEQILEALKEGKIDAAFADTAAWNEDQAKKVVRQGTNHNCYLDGNGMMARKDNEFISYWNTAFAKLRDGGKWNKFCEETNMQHADVGNVRCRKL